VNDTNVEEPVEEEPVKKDFTVQDLQNFISEIYEPTDFNRVDNLWVARGWLHNWIIEDVQFEKAEEFDQYTNAKNWETWKVYTDQVRWGTLHTYMSATELSNILPEYTYKRYRQETTIVDYDVQRTAVSTKFGNIPLYEMQSTIVSDTGYYQDNWEEPLAVFQIPCTEDFVVYYRPKDSYLGKYQASNQKKEEVINFWRKRTDKVTAARYAEQIMEFCGVDETTSTSSYTFSERKGYNPHVYYRNLIEYAIKPKITVGQGKIQGINLTFTHYDYRDLYDNAILGAEIYIRSASAGYVTDDDFDDLTIQKYRVSGGKEFKAGETYNEEYSKGSKILIKPYIKIFIDSDDYQDSIYNGIDQWDYENDKHIFLFYIGENIISELK